MAAFVRFYRMTARAGEGGALRDALAALAAKVRPIEGCEGTELLEDAEQPGQFVFLERWASADAHKAGGKLLGKDAFAPIMAVLAGPPEASSLTPLG
ncbi:putative quinol monooxygenase [Novosphingobium lentum]|uniref:putative quinol monooxygenase n=1 Tax=Novosphingobium lentum TaxID=145287 RepID=UPI0008371962|nr:antibiotic biosynthesis monooxygenase family protein [Novosphingobium lentum]